MSSPFLAEIKMIAFNFAPKGWALANGQLLPINQNQALFSLMGTTFGGNGTTNFALPELRGRVPVHPGNGNGAGQTVWGERGGAESVTITATTMPAHTHAFNASTATATKRVPTGKLLATDSASIADYYAAPGGTIVSLNPGSLSTANGGGQAHTNMQPYIVVGMCVALQGIFPSRN